MSHPKAVEPIGIHLDEFDDAQLRREVGMMQSEQTPNDIIDRELEIIERMKRDRVVYLDD